MTSVNRASEAKGSVKPDEASGGGGAGLASPEVLFGTSLALTAASFIPVAAPIATPLRGAASVAATAGVYQALAGDDGGEKKEEAKDAGADKKVKKDAPKAEGPEAKVELAKGEGLSKNEPTVFKLGNEMKLADTTPNAPAPRTLEATASVDAKGPAPSSVAA